MGRTHTLKPNQLRIRSGTREYQRYYYTRHPLLENAIKVEIQPNYIRITKRFSLTTGEVMFPHYDHTMYRFAKASPYNVPHGTYTLNEEESTKDSIIFYFDKNDELH